MHAVSTGLPEKASDTSAEAPWPVRVLSLKIGDYVDRMSPLWVEGQVVQLHRRGTTAYLTLRDPDVETQQKAIDAIVRANDPDTSPATSSIRKKPAVRANANANATTRMSPASRAQRRRSTSCLTPHGGGVCSPCLTPRERVATDQRALE